MQERATHKTTQEELNTITSVNGVGETIPLVNALPKFHSSQNVKGKNSMHLCVS